MIGNTCRGGLNTGNTDQGLLGLWMWEYKEYSGYSVTLA